MAVTIIVLHGNIFILLMVWLYFCFK